MIRWELLDKVIIADSTNELRLYKHDKDFIIKIDAYELMNSRAHNSEDMLAKAACAKIIQHKEQNVLIGGLGMGFTLKVALENLKARARVTVAELVPEVVKWNRSFLAHLNKTALDDKRVTIYEGSVADKINSAYNIYHAILLDVDNGAQGLTQKNNDGLYTHRGLKAAYDSLVYGGVLAIWSAGPDERFVRRLEKAKFKVEEIKVRSRVGKKGGPQSVVWLAVK